MLPCVIWAVEEAVLREVEDNTATRTRTDELALDMRSSNLWKILNEEEMDPYPAQREQALKPGVVHSNVWRFGSCLPVNCSLFIHSISISNPISEIYVADLRIVAAIQSAKNLCGKG